MVLTIRESPVVAVAELVIRLTPGRGRRAGDLGAGPPRQAGAGRRDPGPPRSACFALAGRLARRGWWRPLLVWFALAGLGLLAPCWRSAAPGLVDTLPVLVGLVTWVTAHSALTDALRRERRRPDLESRERRVFVMVAGAVSLAAVGIAVGGRVVGAGRRHVEASRRLLRIPGVTRREAPAATSVGLAGHRAVADAQRGLLPDRHHPREADHRARGLVAAHPRTGRPRARPELLRPRRAAR